jgi:hypothetical protein
LCLVCAVHDSVVAHGRHRPGGSRRQRPCPCATGRERGSGMKAGARKYGRRRAVARGRQVLTSRAGQAMTEFSLARRVLTLIFLDALDVGRAYHAHVALSTPRASASSTPSKESTPLRYRKVVRKPTAALPSLVSPTLSPRPSMRLAQQAMTPTRLMRGADSQFYLWSTGAHCAHHQVTAAAEAGRRQPSHDVGNRPYTRPRRAWTPRWAPPCSHERHAYAGR